MLKISNYLKGLRAEKKLTFEDLSGKTKLSIGFLSRLEKGDYDEKNISLATIIRLATGFDIKVKDLLDQMGILEQNQLPAIGAYLREKYNIQSTEDAKTIENIINRLNESQKYGL